MSELPTASVAAANRQTIWNKAFVSIFLINIVLNVGQFMMNTLIPKFAEHLGGTALIVGMVSSMFAVTALGIRPVVGPATGYFRHNRLLAAAIGMIIVAFICYGFASTIGMLVVGRLFHGVGMGFLAPLCLSLASDALPSHKIASGIGIFSLGQAVATAIGPSIGLELVKGVGYNHTFQIGAALMAVVLLLALRLQTRAPNREQGFRISMSTVVAPEVVLPALIMLFLAGAYSTINSFILIYGKACGVQEIGLFFTAYAVCVLFTRPFSGRMADKYGLDKILIPAMLMFALSFVLISFSRTLPMFLLSGAVSAFGYGICQPVIQTLCMKLVPQERRGIAGNTSYIGVDIGYLVTPSIAGAIVTLSQSGGGAVAGYAVMFQVMTLPIAIALVLFLFRRRRLMAAAESEA